VCAQIVVIECGAQITRLMNDNYAKKCAKDNLQHLCKYPCGTDNDRKKGHELTIARHHGEVKLFPLSYFCPIN